MFGQRFAIVAGVSHNQPSIHFPRLIQAPHGGRDPPSFMSKVSKRRKRQIAARAKPGVPLKADFEVVLDLIDAARKRALAAVNTTLIDLYWRVGEFISHRVAAAEWGQGTVEALGAHIQARLPNPRGFSARNLWRMAQFFETYADHPKLAPLLRELSWSHNLLIMGRCKRAEEREFYLRLCGREKWTKRELERQLSCALFERTVLSPAKLSPVVTELHPDATAIFKDSYLVEFLDLSGDHSEADLQRALVAKLKQFLIELGRDFCFVGSQFPLQVGGRDFSIDLLFFNRALNCLVAFELKIEEFQPERRRRSRVVRTNAVRDHAVSVLTLYSHRATCLHFPPPPKSTN